MGKLSDWAKSNSPYISLKKTGDEFTGIFKGYKFIGNKFDPEKQAVRYTFVVNNEEKIYDSSNSYVALAMDTMKADDIVCIKRLGEGKDTKYSVEKVDFL